MLQKYKEIFPNNPGKTHLLTHMIIIKGPQLPPNRPYGATGKVQEQSHAGIQNMLELGVIKESDSSWASPMVLVHKKENTGRFCVDYRKLSAVTVPDVYPMPQIDDLLDILNKAKYLCSFDLT